MLDHLAHRRARPGRLASVLRGGPRAARLRGGDGARRPRRVRPARSGRSSARRRASPPQRRPRRLPGARPRSTSTRSTPPALAAGGRDNGAPGMRPAVPPALLRRVRPRPGRQQRRSRLPHAAMSTRGFFRRRAETPDGRLPPGQYLERGFPVLSAGPTPRTPLERVDFAIAGEVDERAQLDLGGVPGAAAGARRPSTSTASRRGASSTPTWEGVSVDTLLDGIEPLGGYVTAFCDGGYTTNLPIEDITGGKAWVVYELRRRRRSSPSTAAPPACSSRTCTSGRARSGCAACIFMRGRRAGLLGDARLPRPWGPLA